MKDKRGIDFVRNLVKGKIAEIVFQHMFAESDFATVLPFGYEHLMPLLAQYQHLIETQEALAHVRYAPDFILVKPDNTQIVLVDVKYRRRKDSKRAVEIARAVQDRWEPAWLFLATPDGFFFAPCSQVVTDGDIPPLPERWIPKRTQDEYLALMNEFER
jgi:hypothetical protein